RIATGRRRWRRRTVAVGIGVRTAAAAVVTVGARPRIALDDLAEIERRDRRADVERHRDEAAAARAGDQRLRAGGRPDLAAVAGALRDVEAERAGAVDVRGRDDGVAADGARADDGSGKAGALDATADGLGVGGGCARGERAREERWQEQVTVHRGFLQSGAVR